MSLHLCKLKILFIILCIANTTFAQQQTIVTLIKADSGWGKEVFYFPISFAPELKYKGYEEARFPKGWAKKDSTSFWSYAFAWKIEATKSITTKELVKNLTFYFDGLMKAQSNNSSKKMPKTKVLLVQQSQTNSRSNFKGKIQIFDAFTLQAPLLLYLTIEQVFCATKKQSILLFRFSPKVPEHSIWVRLNELAILDSIIKDGKCK